MPTRSTNNIEAARPKYKPMLAIMIIANMMLRIGMEPHQLHPEIMRRYAIALVNDSNIGDGSVGSQ